MWPQIMILGHRDTLAADWPILRPSPGGRRGPSAGSPDRDRVPLKRQEG
jgi:hypothetical protein